jgi:hypothetical protein
LLCESLGPSERYVVQASLSFRSEACVLPAREMAGSERADKVRVASCLTSRNSNARWRSMLRRGITEISCHRFDRPLRKSETRIGSGEKFVQRLAAYQARFELMMAIDVALQRCFAKRFSNSGSVRSVRRQFHSTVRCKRARVLRMCIGNHHSTIMARRKHAESA